MSYIGLVSIRYCILGGMVEDCVRDGPGHRVRQGHAISRDILSVMGAMGTDTVV